MNKDTFEAILVIMTGVAMFFNNPNHIGDYVVGNMVSIIIGGVGLIK